MIYHEQTHHINIAKGKVDTKKIVITENTPDMMTNPFLWCEARALLSSVGVYIK